MWKEINLRREVVLIENDKNDDVLERHGAADNDAIFCFTQENSLINSKMLEESRKYVTSEFCMCVHIVQAVFDWQRLCIGWG